MSGFLQDVRYAVQQLLKSPGVTLVALLSLALGIGANTAIFSLMDTVMLKSLPVKEPVQLVLFGNGLDSGISDGFPNPWLYSYPFYREMRKRNQVFSAVAAAFSMTDRVHGTVAGRSDAETMNIQMVSGTYFPMLGVQALVGRTISEEDDQTEGRNPVAVVSYAWWTRSLSRDASVLDQKFTIGSTTFSIIGVAPPEFFGTKVGEVPDMWILWLVLREVLILAAVGVAIGIPVSLAGDRFVSSMLFGLRGADALGLLSAVGLLVVVAVIAGYLPARRASLIDPMVALRYE